MARTLYFVRDLSGTSFGVRPYSEAYRPEYAAMTKKIGLKQDLGWDENHYLQNVLRKSDIWADFPDKGYTLIDAEFRPGSQNQRIDILYMTNDGGLMPCELKLGGQAKDTHGQLLRYMADLAAQSLSLAWIYSRHKNFLSKISSSVAHSLHEKKLSEFIVTYGIMNNDIHPQSGGGLIIDEQIPSECAMAVRYLNNNWGLSIRMMELHTFVGESWTASQTDFKFRIDFVDLD